MWSMARVSEFFMHKHQLLVYKRYLQDYSSNHNEDFLQITLIIFILINISLAWFYQLY